MQPAPRLNPSIQPLRRNELGTAHQAAANLHTAAIGLEALLDITSRRSVAENPILTDQQSAYLARHMDKAFQALYALSAALDPFMAGLEAEIRVPAVAECAVEA
jgi:hypothetical protein